MIRFPKRPIKTDRIDDADILEIEVADDAEATSELHVIEDADLVLAPMAPEPEGVKNVMASLEAEVSRVLADQRSVLGASHASRASSPSLREDVSPPLSAPPPSAHVHASAPVSVRPSDPRPSAPSSPFVVAQAVVVASSPRLPSIVADPKANDGKVVVVREKPAFAWAIACLALGALGAIVGMKVASGLTRPQAPLVVTVPAAQAPVPPLALAPVASAPLAATAIAPTPESLLSAAPPAPTTAPAVVAFDEKDAVHVLAAPPPVAVAQAPQAPPAPPVAPASPVSSASASASAKAAVSAKPGDPPPLLPDAPSKPVVVAPPPPPAKPARPKTPQEQLLEAQLKAASQ